MSLTHLAGRTVCHLYCPVYFLNLLKTKSRVTIFTTGLLLSPESETKIMNFINIVINTYNQGMSYNYLQLHPNNISTIQTHPNNISTIQTHPNNISTVQTHPVNIYNDTH